MRILDFRLRNTNGSALRYRIREGKLRRPGLESAICNPESSMLRLTDLREILRYVPRFRDRVFVIAVDGAIVEDDNFPNILLDIALLRSLSIRVALVHGAARQVKRFAELVKMTPSDL